MHKHLAQTYTATYARSFKEIEVNDLQTYKQIFKCFSSLSDSLTWPVFISNFLIELNKNFEIWGP